MVEHLAELGHQRIVYLDSPPRSWSRANKPAAARADAMATGVYGALIAWLIAGAGMLMLAFVFQKLANRKPDLDAGVYAYARAGFTYEFSVAWGAKAALSAGYEINTYLNAINRSFFFDDVTDSNSTTRYSNFDLSGPYAAFKVIY